MILTTAHLADLTAHEQFRVVRTIARVQASVLENRTKDERRVLITLDNKTISPLGVNAIAGVAGAGETVALLLATSGWLQLMSESRKS